MGDVPLVCSPFAGAGASFFRPWSPRRAGQFDVIPVQLPGREKRFGEAPHTNVSAAIGEVLPELSRSLRSRSDVVVFGHSLGAVLAYELTRRASCEGGFQVKRLVVSGSPAPSRQRDREIETRLAAHPRLVRDPDIRGSGLGRDLRVARVDGTLSSGIVTLYDDLRADRSAAISR